MLRLDDTSEQNILNMLVEHKTLNLEQIKRIKSTSKEVGKTELETALELELANEEEILKIFSDSYSLPVVELKNYKLDNKLKKIVKKINIAKLNKGLAAVIQEYEKSIL